MTVASIPSRALLGIDAVEVMVEAHLSAGLPGFTLVGLPETAVKESRERVRSAIINSALEFPDQRVTVNLAPADLPKAGGRYDLAIAVATLVASEQIEGFAEAIRGIEMLGELALDGGLRPVPGVVQALLAARKDGRAIIVPAANREALEIVDYSLALGLDSLTELTAPKQTAPRFSQCLTRRAQRDRNHSSGIRLKNVSTTPVCSSIQYEAKLVLCVRSRSPQRAGIIF